jgi:pyridoxal phosphate enzyme (YggS family)
MTTATSPAFDEAAERFATLRESIDRAARLTQRTADDIRLIAVSKTHGADAIRPLIEAGQRVFGENRVQESQEKWPALREEYPDIELHLVGQLQSNKAAEAVALFDVIHSLDRPSLLTALVKAMDAAGKRIPCFIQVNIGGEAQKGGCAIADTPALIAAARDADIPLLGLMCVPPADIEAAPFFALLAKMAREEGLPRLSMGMSGDYETAIMLGATDIRVGTALFGERPSPARLQSSRKDPASGRGMVRNSRAG